MKSFKNWNFLNCTNFITFALAFLISFKLTDTHSFNLIDATEGVHVRRTRALKFNHNNDRRWGPFFEESNNSTQNGEYVNLKAHLYSEAVLNCKVGMLKDKIVMWVKRSSEKVSLLTVGNITYSGDPRINVKFQYPNNWRLFINPTQQEDEGIYMCQVSTHPPRTFITNLTIIEPPLRIIDDEEREIGDRYYKTGSTINLRCQVSKNYLRKANLCANSTLQTICTTNAQDKFQTKTNQIELEFNNNKLTSNALELSKGLVSWTKDDDKLPDATIYDFSLTEKWLNSHIILFDAKITDSGNYSCSVAKLFSAIVQVQVLTGESPAAVQHNAAYTFFENEVRPWLIFYAIFQYIWNY